MYFTRSILHFHVFHMGRSPIRIRPTEKYVYFSTLPSFFFTKLTMQSQKKMNFSMPLHRKHCKEGAIVVTQFWIHQDFLEYYFISSIIYKNPKKLRKSLKLKKNILLESTASFHKNRFHRVNTGQTMSTKVKNEFSVKTESTESIRVKPCQLEKKMSFRPFRVKTVIFGQNRVHRVNTGPTMSTGVKNEFQVILGQNCYFWSKNQSTRLIPIEKFFFSSV